MPLSGEQILGAVDEFANRWADFAGTEKAAAQTFLNELVGCYTGAKSVLEVGAGFEHFGPTDEGSGYMDLYWQDRVIVEMKRPSEGHRLVNHRAQVLDYWKNSADVAAGRAAPRYLVLCSFNRFEVWEPGAFPKDPLDQFSLDELLDHYESLLFLAGDEPLFGGPGEAVTKAAAETAVRLYMQLVARSAVAGFDDAVLRDFMLQVIWCLFAEDLGMLQHQPVRRIVEGLIGQKERSSAAELGYLFTILNLDEKVGRGGIYAGAPYANGGLFARPARVHLLDSELELLAEAAAYDWRKPCSPSCALFRSSTRRAVAATSCMSRTARCGVSKRC